MLIRRLFGIGLLSTLLLTLSPAYSDEKNGAGSDAPSSTQLKGTVIQVDVQLNNLTDARLDISRARKAIANLYDEVTRQQVTMNYSPNMVGSMMIMTPTPSFSGAVLPARKKWVDESIADIVPIIKLFKEEVDAAIENNKQVDVSEATHKQMEPIRDEVFKSVKSSFVTLTQLEKETNARSYNNQAIASSSKTLDKQMKDLDKNLKKAISLLQKEAKSKKG